MNAYDLRREGRWKGLILGSADFHLYKNNKPFGDATYLRRQLYRLHLDGYGKFEIEKPRWNFFRTFILLEDGEIRHKFKGKETKLNGEKLWVDSRSFIHLGWEKICSIDPWDKNWPGDESLLYKWEYENSALELPITILALLAALDYADRY